MKNPIIPTEYVHYEGLEMVSQPAFDEMNHPNF